MNRLVHSNKSLLGVYIITLGAMFGRGCYILLPIPFYYYSIIVERYNTIVGWLGSRVASVLDSGAEGPGFKSQPRRCRVTVLGKLLTPIVPLFTKQENW